MCRGLMLNKMREEQATNNVMQLKYVTKVVCWYDDV